MRSVDVSTFPQPSGWAVPSAPGVRLVARLHIDLCRLASAICRVSDVR